MAAISRSCAASGLERRQTMPTVRRGQGSGRRASETCAERVSIGSSEPPFLASLDQFVEFVRDGHFDQLEQNEAGRLIAEGHAAKLLNMRSTLLTLAGGDPMPAAAISKLLSMKTGQGYAEFGVSSFGTDAAVGDQGQPSGKWAEYLLAGRATTIYGGTSEVQLNIIAERLLGLPRDP